jgi:galactokinase
MTQTINTFRQFFDRKPSVISRAPGRLEILGNHTDYNDGIVLSCAVEQHTSFAVAPARDKKICRIKDYKYDSEASFDLDDIDNPKPGEWANYLKGVISELNKRDIFVVILYWNLGIIQILRHRGSGSYDQHKNKSQK